MMTAGYCADTMIELYFRNNKGVKSSRWCTPGNTYSCALIRAFSAELRRAMLHETLCRHFTFVDVRMSDVCADLKKLIDANKFMDDDPFNKDKYKQSTYQRWNAQVSECTLHGSGTSRHFIRLVSCNSVHFSRDLETMCSSFMKMFLSLLIII